jgi:glycosyltransferase involved in cell wall biosynthesis
MSHLNPSRIRRRLSIGLPVYNGAEWVADALDSLLAQTFRDFELIISDNASTDATRQICEKYAASDERIRYVRQEINRGLVWNWNRVFELSHSKYFKWAACDDVLRATFLERCIEVLDRNPDVVWCHTRSRHIDATGKLLLGDRTPEISYLNESRPGDSSKTTASRASALPSDRFSAVLLGRGGCLDSYGVIRSEILRKTALYIPYYGSEKVLMAELALWGRYEEVPESLCFARVHEKTAGNMRSKNQQRSYINPFSGKWQFDRLGLLRGYLSAVRRAKLPIGERLRCYAVIGQYLFQIRKWTVVLTKAITGAGLAAEYPTTAAKSPAASSRLTATPNLPR